MELIKASLIAAAMQGGGGSSDELWEYIKAHQQIVGTVDLSSLGHTDYHYTIGSVVLESDDFDNFRTDYSYNTQVSDVIVGNGSRVTGTTGYIFSELPAGRKTARQLWITANMYNSNDELLATWVVAAYPTMFNDIWTTTSSARWSGGGSGPWYFEGNEITQVEYNAGYYGSEPHVRNWWRWWRATEYDMSTFSMGGTVGAPTSASSYSVSIPLTITIACVKKAYSFVHNTDVGNTTPGTVELSNTSTETSTIVSSQYYNFYPYPYSCTINSMTSNASLITPFVGTTLSYAELVEISAKIAFDLTKYQREAAGYTYEYGEGIVIDPTQ